LGIYIPDDWYKIEISKGKETSNESRTEGKVQRNPGTG
jgi:hypothetical protein